MLTYEEAYAIAKRTKSRINYCIEYNNAYEFGYDDGQMHKGGESPVAVMKETGEALNFISYAIMPGGGKIIREFEVK